MPVQFLNCFAKGICIGRFLFANVYHRFRAVFIAMLLFASTALHAQQQSVSGTVYDDQNKPLANASVQVSGTKKGTVTDEQGRFTILVSKGNVLVISSVGYVTQRLKISENNNYHIVLAPSNDKLSDVVVVGVQQQTRRNTVAAISGITSKDIENKPVASVDQLLQGRVAGVNVQISSGEPGVAPTTVIRGNSKVNTQIGGSENVQQAQALSGPLYVIDGIPIDPNDISNNTLDATGTNFLAGININDIQDVQIQKDAAATAAWGSRGANGVIYITTKKGTSKIPLFSVNYYEGVEQRPELLPTLTGAAERQQKVAILKAYATSPDQLAAIPQLLSDSLNPSFNNATDWQGLFYKTGHIRNADATMSASSDVVNYRLSMNYYDEEGIIKNTGYQRYSLRGNFGFTISPKLNSQLIVGLVKQDRQRGEKYSNDQQNTPFDGSHQPTSFYYVNGFDSSNFLALGNSIRNRNIDDNYSASLTTNYDILPGLRYTLQGSANIHQQNRDYFLPSSAAAVAYNLGSLSNNQQFTSASQAEADRSTYSTYLVFNTLNYSKSFNTGNGNAHHINALLSQQYNSNISNTIVAKGTNTPTNDIQVVSGIPQSDISASSNYLRDGLLSVIGQLQYDYNGKYLVYGSYRGDASSRFGPNNKWGYFPAGGVGWIVSDEKFMQKLKSVVSLFKLRFSYGEAGENAPNFYAPYNSYVVPGTYNGNQQILPSYTNGLTKNNLSWSKTQQKDLGVELNLFGSRVNLVTDFYDKLTTNDFFDLGLPFFTGYQSINFNAADLWVDNRGVDITLNTNNLSTRSKLQWHSTFVLSFNKNTIAKLPDNNRTFVMDDYSGISRLYQVGQPIYEMFQMQYQGVYNNQSQIPFNPITGNPLTYFKRYYPIQPGYPKWRDVNGDGDVWVGEDNGDQYGDRVASGNPNPKFTGGFTNDFTYKNFSLTVSAIFTWKRTVVNTFEQQQFDNAFENGLTGFAAARLPDLRGVNYWTPQNAKSPNYSASFPEINPYAPYFYQFFPFSTMYNVDGSYLKIKFVTLNYTLPQRISNRLKVKRINAYAMATNVLIVKNKNNTMPDPEAVDQFGDYTGSLYPQPKVYTLGLNINF